jgi:hypothetical protein
MDAEIVTKEDGPNNIYPATGARPISSHSRKKSVVVDMRRGVCGRKKVGVAGKRRGGGGWKRNENGIRKPKR